MGARGGRALRENALADALARNAGVPPEVHFRVRPIDEIAARFECCANVLEASEEDLDAALLHMLDVHAPSVPRWLRVTRAASLVKRGFMRWTDDGAILVWRGAEEQARLAGRSSPHQGVPYDAPVCACPICATMKRPLPPLEDTPPLLALIEEGGR